MSPPSRRPLTCLGVGWRNTIQRKIRVLIKSRIKSARQVGTVTLNFPLNLRCGRRPRTRHEIVSFNVSVVLSLCLIFVRASPVSVRSKNSRHEACNALMLLVCLLRFFRERRHCTWRQMVRSGIIEYSDFPLGEQPRDDQNPSEDEEPYHGREKHACGRIALKAPKNGQTAHLDGGVLVYSSSA